MLEVHYGVSVALAADGRHLDVTGPRLGVEAAVPMLLQQRAVLLAHLRAIAPELASTEGVPSSTGFSNVELEEERIAYEPTAQAQ